MKVRAHLRRGCTVLMLLAVGRDEDAVLPAATGLLK